MGGFAAFATGFVGGLNNQHEDARAQEAKWLEDAGARFDERYKAKREYDGKVAERARKVQAAAAYFDGDEDMAIVAVDSGLDYTNPEVWQRLRKSRPAKASPVAQQTQQAGMAPKPSPQDQQNLSQIKQTPTQQDQVKAPAQAGPQQAQLGPRKSAAPIPEVFKPTIEALAERTKLDPAVIGAVFMTESAARPEVINGSVKSSAGAVGPMQTMPDTLRDPGYGVTPARDNSVDEQWRVGADYLAAMQRKYNDLPTALMAYNWGPGHVDAWLTNPKDPANPNKVPAETRQYVDKVMSRLPGARPVGPTKEAAQTQQMLGQTPTATQEGSAAATPSVTTSPTSNAMEQAPMASEEAPEGRSGWQTAGDLLTGRRDPREVADRGAVKAGSQYGLSPEESMEIMRGDYIGGEQQASPGTRISFGDKPVDVAGIAESILKDRGNFIDSKVHAFAVELAKTDPAAALELADPMAVKAAEENMKAMGGATTAHQTMMQNAVALAKANEISVGQALSQLLGQVDIKSDAMGGFARTDNSKGTAQPIQTLDANGKPTIRVSAKEAAETEKQLMQASEAQIISEQLIEAIRANPRNIGVIGQGKEIVATVGGMAGGPIGKWAEEYFEGDEIARINSLKQLLTGKLMPAITGDTSRFSENDRLMVKEAQGNLDKLLASAGGAISALELINQITRRGAAYSLHQNQPNLSEISLGKVLAQNYVDKGKDPKEALRLAKEDLMGLRKYKYGTRYGTE